MKNLPLRHPVSNPSCPILSQVLCRLRQLPPPLSNSPFPSLLLLPFPSLLSHRLPFPEFPKVWVFFFKHSLFNIQIFMNLTSLFYLLFFFSKFCYFLGEVERFIYSNIYLYFHKIVQIKSTFYFSLISFFLWQMLKTYLRALSPLSLI